MKFHGIRFYHSLIKYKSDTNDIIMALQIHGTIINKENAIIIGIIEMLLIGIFTITAIAAWFIFIKLFIGIDKNSKFISPSNIIGIIIKYSINGKNTPKVYLIYPISFINNLILLLNSY